MIKIDSQEQTPLHYACIQENENIVVGSGGHGTKNAKKIVRAYFASKMGQNEYTDTHSAKPCLKSEI